MYMCASCLYKHSNPNEIWINCAFSQSAKTNLSYIFRLPLESYHLNFWVPFFTLSHCRLSCNILVNSDLAPEAIYIHSKKESREIVVAVLFQTLLSLHVIMPVSC